LKKVEKKGGTIIGIGCDRRERVDERRGRARGA
jgi:hypothetical protein